MSRRKFTPIKKISLLEVFNSLTEAFNSSIETNFSVINFDTYFACRFKTDSGHEYDLEFHESEELPNTILDGKKLSDIIKPRKGIIQCLDIAFSLTNVKDKTNPAEFEKETNLFEHHEVMGRITYICNIIIKRNIKYKLFIVGGDALRNKLKIYETIFKNNFNDMFELYHAQSQWHEGNSLFIIRK